MTVSPQLYAVTSDMVEQRTALVLPTESGYVTETSTGLTFSDDTPIELWGGLVERLILARERISFALADAINFGRRRYGEMYAQWVHDTGLKESTLANVAWVGRRIESSRRREGVDFTYHQAVAALPPEDQDRLLDAVEQNGWKRYELRQAVEALQEERKGPSPTLLPDPESEPSLSSAPPTTPAETWLLIAELAGFINDQVTTKIVLVDGITSRHDRHCTFSAEHQVCSRKCQLARSLIERAELLG